MRALRMVERGSAPVLEEIPRPNPAAGEVLVDIAACGLNFADLLMIDGSYQERPPLPFTLGLEAAGTVSALGDGVRELAVGARIAVFGGRGGLADFGVFDARNCVALPDGMTFEQAAAFQVAYGTSHVALKKARLQSGETLLVLGAAGGVGLTAVEIGKLMGARVIACAGGPEKLAVCRKAGADEVVDSAAEDVRDRVKALGGADVVYDPVGGDLFNAALRATNRDGRIIVIGFASGDVPPIPANIILVKNITVVGVYWGGYLAFKPEVVTGSLGELFGWFAEGGLRPHISHSFPLTEAAEALETLRTRKSTGKVVVRMTD